MSSSTASAASSSLIPYREFAGDDGSPELELANALTVHKTQGCQFGQTFLVVPKLAGR